MRTEQEMMALILGFAEKDGRVRAVAMNGSRTNPNAPKDLFQDYDIVYLVTETDSFTRDHRWVDAFGERIILQMPDAMGECAPREDGRFCYLMLFADGNRIDLRLIPAEQTEAYLQEDKLTVALLDKDGLLPALPPPTDEDYRLKRPTVRQFDDCCNEFWWVSTYVAKGLWRREFLYAQEHMNACVRPMLIRMLGWRAGFDTDFAASAGKCGKYLERLVPREDGQDLLATFASGSYDGAWEALFAMGDLFRRTAREVAARLGCDYPTDDDRRVSRYLRNVRRLPPDAAAYRESE